LDVFSEEETAAHMASQIERAAAAGADVSVTVEDKALHRAAIRAGRRRLAAQSSLFDLANQKVADRLREADAEELTAEEAKQLLTELQKQLI
jgi:hypothetical protein